MLQISAEQVEAIAAEAYARYPYEACGLIAGPGGSARVEWFYPCHNAAGSGRVYTIEPMDHLRAERDAEDRGWDILGVVHSHTHTEPFPSPTDIAQAPDPDWHYVIVGLKREVPEVRSYRIRNGVVAEEPLEIHPPVATDAIDR
jgi:proteasome lid subunit RPN8/RPN11